MALLDLQALELNGRRDDCHDKHDDCDGRHISLLLCG